MSSLWVIRLLLIGMLITWICVFGFFLKNRVRYKSIIENTPFNIFLILMYNALCYGSVILPHDDRYIPEPALFDLPIASVWYRSLGAVVALAGIFLLLATVNVRRKVGIQDTDGRLYTSGIYSFARHPIYVGIIFISMGLALVLLNIDGMAVLPLIFFANFLEAKFEERYDMGVRFSGEYSEYKKQVKLFGPYWLWMLLFLLCSIPFAGIMIQ